jgi:hypothetical protein
MFRPSSVFAPQNTACRMPFRPVAADASKAFTNLALVAEDRPLGLVEPHLSAPSTDVQDKGSHGRSHQSQIKRGACDLIMFKEATLEEPTRLQIQSREWVFARRQEIMSCRRHHRMAVLGSLNSYISRPILLCIEENDGTGTMGQRCAGLARRMLGGIRGYASIGGWPFIRGDSKASIPPTARKVRSVVVNEWKAEKRGRQHESSMVITHS